MSTNISKSNVSFGKFKFYNGAKCVLKEKIKTKEELDAFNEVCAKENLNTNREITVNTTNDRLSRLSVNYGDGWHNQGFFQSTLNFLKKSIAKADEYSQKQAIKNSIDDTINNL